MSEIQLRPLKENDLQRIRSLLGLGIMQQLATMNNRAYVHPLTVLIWVGLSSALVTYMKWWPSDINISGSLRFLSPCPAFAAVLIPVMFFFDWYQRDYFEEEVQKAIKAPDMASPVSYYNQSPASGFFVLERKDIPIGFVAIDASKPSSGTEDNRKGKAKASEANDVAVIRHFHLYSKYHPTGVQEDLLNVAVSRAFNAKSAPLPHKIRVIDSDLQSYKKKAFALAGFHPIGKEQWDGEGLVEWSAGVYRWRFRWLEVTREEWEARQEQESEMESKKER